jgi:hypothetical protein
MADAEIAVEDDHRIGRLLERGQQEFGTFDRCSVGGAHR